MPRSKSSARSAPTAAVATVEERESSAAPAPPAPRALLWIGAGQEALAQGVATHAGLDVRIVGGAPAGAARGLAEAIGADAADDFRHALRTADVDVVVALTVSDRGEREALEDGETQKACAERGVALISIEPAPASLIELIRPKGHERPARACPAFAPLLRLCMGFRAAKEALEAFGQVTTLDLSCRSGRGEGTLAARVFDAMDAVVSLMGPPETIDASVRGPCAESGLRLAAGESLALLRGDMTAHLRYSDGRSAALTLSERGGRWFRGATMIGENGCLRVDEQGFEWLDASGALVDSSGGEKRKGRAGKAPGRSASPEAPVSGAAAAIGEQIRRLLDPRSQETAPVDLRNVLATAEAALLSARTGQPESPATMLRMAGAV